MMLAMINQKLRAKQDRLYLAFVEVSKRACVARSRGAAAHCTRYGGAQMDKDRSGWLSVQEITEVLQKQARAARAGGPDAHLSDVARWTAGRQPLPRAGLQGGARAGAAA